MSKCKVPDCKACKKLVDELLESQEALRKQLAAAKKELDYLEKCTKEMNL